MRFLPLIWSGIWRKPGRTILIFLQVSVAFALFGVLQGLKTGVEHAVDAARADLLIVHSRLSYIMEGLPLALLGQIRTVQKNGSPNWTFEVVGTFTDSDFGGGGDNIIMSLPYYDEARATGRGTVNHINVSVTDPNLAVPVADAIDRLSANSSHETKTESIRELAQQQVQQIGDFDFLIRAVVSAVLAALLFAIATMMVQSVHERTSELAVLKTIGFTDRAVFMLILAEALSVCILAGAFGLALATAALPIAARVVTGLSMPKITLAIGLGFAVLVALISAAVPALFAARLRVSTALAEP